LDSPFACIARGKPAVIAAGFPFLPQQGGEEGVRAGPQNKQRNQEKKEEKTGFTRRNYYTNVGGGGGGGVKAVAPGKTFVGGLSISFFMTLLVTPVMYSILNSRHDRKRVNS
jgi:hypothetical protein